MHEILVAHNRKSIWYGDISLIEECAKMSALSKPHPKLLIKSVLDSLDKSNLFYKSLIIADFDGAKRKYRCYTIAEPQTNQETRRSLID